MNNLSKCLIILFLSLFLNDCGEKVLNDPVPTTILLSEQVWNDEKMILSLLANYYARLPFHSQINSGESNYAAYDEGIATGSEGADLSNNNILVYSYDRWTLWPYDLIRDINFALEGIETYSTSLTTAKKTQFKAELRFLRALVYFEMVKRMGGVPIITNQLIYDYTGDATNLRKSRNKEEEVYDFISSELDDIKDYIGNVDYNTRPNKYTALALKCRAMLYAGSIAKYNNLMPSPITMPGGEVGIPAAKTNGYYQAALDAAKEIITSGKYSLYQKNPNLGVNFYEALVQKDNNPEVIMAMDFNMNKNHEFTLHQICRTVREGGFSGSAVNPPLNLVEAFEYLDGTAGTLKGVGDGTFASQANWIFYDNVSDIFANKDARLYGTIIYPGTLTRGVDANIQAGVYEWNSSTNRYDRYESADFGSLYKDGKLLTGIGGPMRAINEVSNTGFYIRKYVDETPSSSLRGTGSYVWWVRFRYGEVLLNAAEAAFELGGENINEALTYVNMVRERAGHPSNSLDISTLTIERLRNERRIELCYEDHRVWDLARWRQAHILWDGQASNPNAVMYALYPYRIIHPGSANDGKYVFDKFPAPKFIAPRYYRIGNYYSEISQSVLNNNPLIVKNPFH